MEPSTYSSADVLIPWAKDEAGCLIYCADAKPSRDYYCEDCDGVVHRRGGPRMRWHFYHLAREDRQGCSAAGSTRESRIHRNAKRLLARTLCRLQGHPRPSVAMRVQCPFCTTLVPVLLPLPAFSETGLETRDPLTHRRPDVVLTADGDRLFAFEVRYTHGVDATRAESFRVPWLELDATALTRDELVVVGGRLEETSLDRCPNPHCGATAADMTAIEAPPVLSADLAAKSLEAAPSVVLEELYPTRTPSFGSRCAAKPIWRLNRKRQQLHFAGLLVRARIGREELRYFDGTISPARELSFSELSRRLSELYDETRIVTGQPRAPGRSASIAGRSTGRALPSSTERSLVAEAKLAALSHVGRRVPHWYPVSPLIVRQTDPARPDWKRDYFYDAEGKLYGHRTLLRNENGRWVVENTKLTDFALCLD